MSGVKDFWDDLRGATAADAAGQASAQIQENINRGMDLSEAQQGQFRQDLMGGQAGGQTDGILSGFGGGCVYAGGAHDG